MKMALLPDDMKPPATVPGVSFLDSNDPLMVAIELTRQCRQTEQLRVDLAHQLRGVFDDELQAELEKLTGGGLSANTLRSYKAMFSAFRDFCSAEKLPSLPTTPEVVAHYIVAKAAEDTSPRELERTVSAIKWAHVVADQSPHRLFHGHTGNPDDVVVKAALAWARKCHENRKKASREEQSNQTEGK
jgi:hypothetical protein